MILAPVKRLLKNIYRNRTVWQLEPVRFKDLTLFSKTRLLTTTVPFLRWISMCCLWQHFCLLSRHQTTLRWSHSSPPTHRLLLKVQAWQKASPPLRQDCLFQHSFIVTFLLNNLHTETSLTRLNIATPMQVPVVVFLSLISWVSNPPSLKASSKETLLKHPSRLTHTNSECQRKQEQQLTVETILVCFYFFVPSGVFTSPVRTKQNMGEYCAPFLGLLEQLPRT